MSGGEIGATARLEPRFRDLLEPRKMLRNFLGGLSAFLLIGVSTLLLSCGGTSSAPFNHPSLGGVSVSITPATMTVSTGTIQQFVATVNESGQQTVQWQVNGLPGGAPVIGTIDKNGNYTAPQFVPNPANVVITAISNADNTKSGNADVNITGTLYPATVYLSPTGTAYVQTETTLNLSAGVTGPADTSVTWQVNGVSNGNATVGSITPGANNTAIYTAPHVLPDPSTVTITVLSHAETNRSNSCKVLLSAQQPTTATVTITPVLAVVQAQTSFPFKADVINASDPSVTWQINGINGGEPSDIYGAIGSTAADQALFFAPQTIPPLSSTVNVKAISNAQPTRGSTASVSISGATANGVDVSLSTDQDQVPVGAPATFHATVSNASVQSVTWQVNGINGGNSGIGTITPDPTIANQGDYVAPQNLPVPAVVVVGAVPTASPKIAATMPVTIFLPPLNISLVCFPVACMNGTEQLGIGQTQQFQLQVTGSDEQTGTWYVCTNNSQPQNCVLGGNATLGTISPDSSADLVTYTAPASQPSPATVIIKAVPNARPTQFVTSTVTISTQQIITVQVTPTGPLNVEVGQEGGPFTANVVGSPDQNVTWYVNNIPGGNSTVGIVQQDTQFPNEEDYLAPATVPNPATVYLTASPEADPTVVSNKVAITIVPVQNNPEVTISPNPPPPLLWGQSNPNFLAQVSNTSNQVVTWSLAPGSGGVCTDPNPPTPCGTISPLTTDGTFATYTAPQNPPSDPYYVNITATANQSPNPKATVSQEITQNAQASISISPSNPTGQAGSPNLITFEANAINIPDFNQTSIDWQLGCDSLAPPGTNGTGENCGPQPDFFGKCYPDGGGPGLMRYTGPDPNGSPRVCAANTPWQTYGYPDNFTYQTPTVLANPQGQSVYDPVPQCNTTQGQTDGYVLLTVTVDEANCGTQGICQASVCIQITPP